MNLTDYQKGVLLGLLIGEGHFGGDRQQPQITIHMHTRHGPLLEWVLSVLPGGRLYGPYYDEGRYSYRVLFRGPYLRQIVAPLLQSLPWKCIDPHSYGRFTAMLKRYDMYEFVPENGAEWTRALLGRRNYYSSLKMFLKTLPPHEACELKPCEPVEEPGLAPDVIKRRA